MMQGIEILIYMYICRYISVLLQKSLVLAKSLSVIG